MTQNGVEMSKREKGIPPNYSNSYLKEAEETTETVEKREKGIPPNYSNSYLKEAEEST